MLCEGIVPLMHAPFLSPRQKSIQLSRARFLKRVCLCMCFVKSRLCLEFLGPRRSGEGRESGGLPLMTGPCLGTPRHPSTFSIFPLFPWTPVASMLNHLTKRHRERSDRPHGMRIYDSIGGPRPRRTFEVFPCMLPEWPTQFGEIFRKSP
jgi:hypothetical protein